MRVALVAVLVLLTACKKTQETPKAPSSDAAVPSAPGAAPAGAGVTPPAPVRTTCGAEPKGGVVIPASSKASEIRVASTEAKAFVTWWEAITDPNGGHAIDSAIGHVFEGGALGARLTVDENPNLDEPISGAAPVVVGGELLAVTCDYFAPQGDYTCGKQVPGAKVAPLFRFNGISGGGPVLPGIAVVATVTETLLFVPGGVSSDVLVFSQSTSGKKKTYSFADRFGDDPKLPRPDALVAAPSGPDEAAVVYRSRGSVFARRAGFDEKWRGKPTALSTPKALVGAPAVASDGTHVVALFSERARSSDPWHVAMSDLTKTTALALGDQAQGPGIAARGACFVVTWVEGSGKATRTRIGQLCNGVIDPRSVATLSADGVEGGRAYPTKDFVVWQEIPAGKPAELRIAKLACP